jgi:hypothetical protein
MSATTSSVSRCDVIITDKIAGITGFPQDMELFEQLGAPLLLTADLGDRST